MVYFGFTTSLLIRIAVIVIAQVSVRVWTLFAFIYIVHTAHSFLSSTFGNKMCTTNVFCIVSTPHFSCAGSFFSIHYTGKGDQNITISVIRLIAFYCIQENSGITILLHLFQIVVWTCNND